MVDVAVIWVITGWFWGLETAGCVTWDWVCLTAAEVFVLVFTAIKLLASVGLIRLIWFESFSIICGVLQLDFWCISRVPVILI